MISFTRLVTLDHLPQEKNQTDEEENEGYDTNNNDDTGHVEDTGDTVDPTNLNLARY